MNPQVHQLRFPLSAPPLCLDCNHITQRRQVKPTNRNGNAGRWFYVCTHCKSIATEEDKMHVGWSTWDDERGLHASNPLCDCGRPSRFDRTRHRELFWTCASGSCRYHAWCKDGPKDDVTIVVSAEGGTFESLTACEGQLGGVPVMESISQLELMLSELSCRS